MISVYVTGLESETWGLTAAANQGQAWMHPFATEALAPQIEFMHRIYGASAFSCREQTIAEIENVLKDSKLKADVQIIVGDKVRLDTAPNLFRIYIEAKNATHQLAELIREFREHEMIDWLCRIFLPSMESAARARDVGPVRQAFVRLPDTLMIEHPSDWLNKLSDILRESTTEDLMLALYYAIESLNDSWLSRQQLLIYPTTSGLRQQGWFINFAIGRIEEQRELTLLGQPITVTFLWALREPFGVNFGGFATSAQSILILLNVLGRKSRAPFNLDPPVMRMLLENHPRPEKELSPKLTPYLDDDSLLRRSYGDAAELWPDFGRNSLMEELWHAATQRLVERATGRRFASFGPEFCKSFIETQLCPGALLSRLVKAAPTDETARWNQRMLALSFFELAGNMVRMALSPLPSLKNWLRLAAEEQTKDANEPPDYHAAAAIAGLFLVAQEAGIISKSIQLDRWEHLDTQSILSLAWELQALQPNEIRRALWHAMEQEFVADEWAAIQNELFPHMDLQTGTLQHNGSHRLTPPPYQLGPATKYFSPFDITQQVLEIMYMEFSPELAAEFRALADRLGIRIADLTKAWEPSGGKDPQTLPQAATEDIFFRTDLKGRITGIAGAHLWLRPEASASVKLVLAREFSRLRIFDTLAQMPSLPAGSISTLADSYIISLLSNVAVLTRSEDFRLEHGSYQNLAIDAVGIAFAFLSMSTFADDAHKAFELIRDSPLGHELLAIMSTFQRMALDETWSPKLIALGEISVNGIPGVPTTLSEEEFRDLGALMVEFFRRRRIPHTTPAYVPPGEAAAA